jgi:hypothetical protein
LAVDLGSEVLSSLVFTKAYANVMINGKKETYDIAINRVRQMHMDKFPNLANEIRDVFEPVYLKHSLPSMRSLQFGGTPIVRSNARIYNCCYSPLERFDDFADLMVLLMNGCGTGFSVQDRHVSQLPVINEGFDCSITIEDNKKAWGESVSSLLNNPKVVFDYSKIRKEGSALSTGGTASGPGVLIDAHSRVRNILQAALNRKLRPIEAYDIMCHFMDAAIAGGVRRSAGICLFDFDDKEMMNAKEGNWWITNPQRARTNNSVILLKTDKRLKTKIKKIMNHTFKSNSGEPGMYLTEDLNWGANPCQPADAILLTPDGLTTMGEVKVGDTIWSGEGWTKITNKEFTGVKPTFKYNTSRGVFYGTENHKVMQNGVKVQAKDAKSIDWSNGPESLITEELDARDIMDGLVIGDGSVHHASNHLVGLFIGDKDGDYFSSEVSNLIKRERNGIQDKFYEVTTSISSDELPLTPRRSIPLRFFRNGKIKLRGVLRGLFSANGSVISTGKRIALKQTSFVLIEQVQRALYSLGVSSYVTTNKPTVTTHNNGDYLSKESYDLNITGWDNIQKFMMNVGFLQRYKAITWEESAIGRKPVTSQIKKTERIKDQEVFDITVDNDSHVYWTDGCLVSNCVEIGLPPRCMCNLSEVCVTNTKTEKEFITAIESATAIGTLQSTYTDFSDLQPDWKVNCEKYRLLGVSMTGIADNWNLLTDELLAEASSVALATNAQWAKKLGIGVAAKIGCVKPSGSASATLGCSSGIHSAYAPFYLRRMRFEKTHPLAAYMCALYGSSPAMARSIVEDSWSSPQSDCVVSLPIQRKSDIYRKDENAIDQLERMKKIQEKWIKSTYREGANQNNVSITIYYRKTETKTIKDWMMNNLDSFSGLSFFPFESGDSCYIQVPFEEISKEEYDRLYSELVSKDIDFNSIVWANKESLQKEWACSGGACEIL